MKAMILAAGLGERMMPLTQHTPKPLLPLGSHCIIEHTLYRIAQAGIQEVVININRYPKKIMDKLGDGQRYGLHITYSYEEGDPLGTAGGIYQALNLLGSKPFLLVSGDIWTDFPFHRLLEKKVKKGHLILVQNPEFHPCGDFGLLPDQTLTMEGDKYTYANIAVIHPDLLGKHQAGFLALGPILTAAVKNHELTGELYRGDWCNLGTPNQLNALNHRLKS